MKKKLGMKHYVCAKDLIQCHVEVYELKQNLKKNQTFINCLIAQNHFRNKRFY